MQEEAGRVAAAGSRDRKPAELDREDENQDGTEREVGEGEPDQREDAKGAVLPVVAMKSRGNASGDGEGDANEQGGDGEGERVGIPLEYEVDDRVVEAKGLAKIGVEDAVPVVGVLLAERGVET